jgi:uncharacterized protein (TIGR02996 family)
MTDEPTFQHLLTENPDDEATWIVYADWLETNGEAQRAKVVRSHRELAGQQEHVPRLAIARRILDEAKELPRDWLATFPMRRPLVNECWGARDSDEGVYLVKFRPDGTILYKQGNPGGTSDPPDVENGDGYWVQIGDVMAFSISKHDNRKKDFSRQDGVLAAKKARLEGIGSNSDGQIWTWKLAPIEADEFDDDELPELPDKPKDSSMRQTDKAKHLLPKRRWINS